MLTPTWVALNSIGLFAREGAGWWSPSTGGRERLSSLASGWASGAKTRRSAPSKPVLHRHGAPALSAPAGDHPVFLDLQPAVPAGRCHRLGWAPLTLKSSSCTWPRGSARTKWPATKSVVRGLACQHALRCIRTWQKGGRSHRRLWLAGMGFCFSLGPRNNCWPSACRSPSAPSPSENGNMGVGGLQHLLFACPTRAPLLFPSFLLLARHAELSASRLDVHLMSPLPALELHHLRS